MQCDSNEVSISTLLPYHIGTTSPDKLFSSTVLLLREFPSNSLPWMVTAIEETKGCVRLYHPFSRTPISSFRGSLDFNRFHSSLLDVTYHKVVASDDDCWSVRSDYNKVLLFSSQPVSRIDDCSLMVLYHGGQLGGYPPSFNIFYNYVDRFDDILSFRGMVYALDRHGLLYLLSKDKFGARTTLVDEEIFAAGTTSVRWRKRLVGSSTDRKLYLIVREEGMFKVYGLSECKNTRVWIEVHQFGGEQVLFATRDNCFFVAADEFPGSELRNCIVYSSDAFPPYSKTGWEFEMHREEDDSEEENDEIKVFRLGQFTAAGLVPVTSYPGFPLMLWSPPPCVFQPQFQRTSDEYDGAQSDLDDQVRSLIEGPSPPSSRATTNEPTFPSTNDVQNLVEAEVSTAYIPQMLAPPRIWLPRLRDLRKIERLQGVSMHPIDPCAASKQNRSVDDVVQSCSRALTNHQLLEEENSRLSFHGVEVQSNHIPILQEVWKKHGDVLEGSILRSCDAKAMALSCLAKILIILQSPGEGFTNEQAAYIESTLADLRSMRLKVGWLVPFVETIVTIHRQFQADLVALDEAKLKAEKRGERLLAVLEEVKQGLDSI